MDNELKPVHCNCGGEAEAIVLEDYETNEPWHIVQCNKCKIETDEYRTKAEAITAWNKAMGAKDINVPDKEIVLIEPFDANLTHVGYCMCGELVNINYSYCPRCGRKIEWRRMTL